MIFSTIAPICAGRVRHLAAHSMTDHPQCVEANAAGGSPTLRLLATVSLFLSVSASAGAVPVDWTRTFLFSSSGGLENPLVRVGFNPQPEPPAGGSLSFAPPMKVGYPPDPIITHTGAMTGDTFRLLFGLDANMPAKLAPTILGATPVGHLFAFDVLSEGGDVTLFHVALELASSGGGTPIDWVAFNPQPEPPALGLDSPAFGADFTFSSFSDVTLRIQITDANGTPIRLNLVPEPPVLTLVLFAACCAMLVRRLRLQRDLRLL